MLFRSFIAAAAIALAPGVASAATTTLFYDDFDAEVAGAASTVQTTNYTGLTNWTITDGTVDLFTNGGFGLPCGSAGCLDLDGSSGNAVTMQTNAAFNFLAGANYTLSLGFSGKNGNGAETVYYAFAGATPGTFSSPVGSQVATNVQTSVSFGASGSGVIVIESLGGDNFGMLLDWVSLTSTTTAVPLPAGLPLLVAGLGVFGVMRRRQS